MINEIINKYESLGVQFWIENNKLRFRAPVGVLDEDLKLELRSYKEELFNYYSNMDKSVIKTDLSNRYDVFPLTDIQSAYLLGRNNNYEYGGVGCHSYFELTMPILDEKRLEQAWHCVINRHDMLRAIVLSNGHQQVLSNVELPRLQFQDLKGLSKEDVRQKIEQVRNNLSTKQYKTDKWPLYDLHLTTTDENSILHFSIDMLISDFISTSTILADLDHFYYESTKPLPELKITFRDIFLNQQEKEKHTLNQMKKQKDLEYWMERIDKMPEAPELPLLTQNKFIDKVIFNQYKFYIEKEPWDFICKYAQLQKITPSCAILAAYAEVMGLWSKQTSFCMDITILNRPNIHPQINSIVGDFTSIDILQVAPNKNSNFKERAQKLQERLWLDLDHNSFSGVEVLREMNRRHNKKIIMPVVYTSTIGVGQNKNIHGEFLRNAKLTYKISQTPQVWIDCQVSEQNEGVLINWDVRDGIFPKGMIEEAFQSFKELVIKMSINKEIWLDKYPLQLTSDIKQVRKLVNSTDTDIPQGLLQDGFCNNVKNYPNNIALYSEGKYFTYKELSNYAITVQKALLNNGCNKGDFVAIIFEKGIWQIASVLGTLLAGCVYLPIDPLQPVARQNSILKDSKTKYILTSKNIYAKERPCNISIIETEELNFIQNEDIRNIRVDSNEPAYIIHTSGTTGKPKGVVISHKSALNTIVDINKRFNVSSKDKILGLANLAFDLSVYDIFGILSAGGTLILPDANKYKSPDHWCKLLLNNKITLWNSVPAQMEMLLSCLQSRDVLEKLDLRLVLLSGDWIPKTLPNLIKKNSPNAKVISLGGATEAAIWSIIYPIKNVPKNAISIPYGKPLSNQKFYVLNKLLEPCPNWTIGDLYIGGIGLALEYLGNKALTLEKFIIHPITKERLYYTGDVGRYLPDGNIEFLGREDTQVKINGHRIELGEIESVLQNFEGISKSVAIVAENNLKENRLVTFIEPCNLKIPYKYKEENNVIKDMCIKKGKNTTCNIDRLLFSQWVEIGGQTILLDIMKAFKKVGIFTNENSSYSIKDIQLATKTLPKFYSVIRRWLNQLCCENVLEKINDEEKYILKDEKFICDEIYYDSWSKFEKLEEKINYSNKLVEFFKESGNHILDILQGEEKPSNLLFPKGNLEIALAAYHSNLINSSINQVIIQGVLGLIDEYNKSKSKKTIRILEIGAGVGGTSLDLIPALKGLNVEYYFTDVSEFFLNEARINFKKYSWVSYGLFDINKPYWEQGLDSNSWDIIICGNVVHNSVNIPSFLSSLKELTVPGGALIVIEATHESKALLTSMAFQYSLDGITDFRKNTGDKIFLNRSEWKKSFGNVKTETIYCYPEENDTLSMAGQTVFIERFSDEQEKIIAQDIKTYIKSQLPEYMIPNCIEVIPELPLSSNGKINRKLLKQRVENIKEFKNSFGEEPKGDLEIRISQIWKEVLNRENIYRNESFYEAGGDSLLVAQVVGKMKQLLPEAKDLEWDRLLIEILKTPTISGISKTLTEFKINYSHSLKEKEDESTTSFIILSESKESNGPMKVFFPGGMGTITQFNGILSPVIKGVNGRETIAAFNLSNFKAYKDSIPSHKLITTLAEECAKILLNQNTSRFEFIGYCMGGFIAIETARILLESGIEIKPVVTIDTKPCDVIVEYELLLERMFGLLIGADMKLAGHTVNDELLKNAIKELKTSSGRKISKKALFSMSEKYKPVVQCYSELEQKSSEERLSKLIATSSRLSKYELERIHYLFNVFKQNNAGVANYNPDIFMGNIHAFICKYSESAFFPEETLKSENFLKEMIIGDLETRYIEGNHLTCIQSSNGIQLANIFIK